MKMVYLEFFFFFDGIAAGGDFFILAVKFDLI